MSDGEFAMPEFGDLEDLALLMFGMIYLVLLLRSLFLLFLVVVGSLALMVRRAHVHVAGMFARAASILGHTTSPALAITGGGAIHVLQGFVFDVWVGVGGKAPDSGDLLVLVSG
jgi:hypothetical protein